MRIRIHHAARTFESASSQAHLFPCRRCDLVRQPAHDLGQHRQHRRYATTHGTWLTEKEKESEKLLSAINTKMKLYSSVTEGSGSTIQDQIQRAKLIKELSPLAEAFDSYNRLRKAIIDLEPYLSDPDQSLKDMFTAERDELVAELDTSLALFPVLLLPPSSTDPLPLLISLNAGVGGSEASLFVEEMARMYTRFAEKRNWKHEVISQTEGPGGKGGGGLREITMKFEPTAISGESSPVYGLLRWEKGVHRVQRVPLTESMGRVHTSTVGVVVMPIYPDLPEAPLVDPKDVKTEVMRSRGAGGQHVNKTESAVRLTHVPTGITVSMQDSRSQHQNRAWAWDVLRARLSERKHNEEIEARRASRQSQVKGADRSDKVRTYNFPQDRLTDHRIGLNLTGLKEILDGDDLELVISALRADVNARRLESILLGDEDFDD